MEFGAVPVREHPVSLRDIMPKKLLFKQTVAKEGKHYSHFCRNKRKIIGKYG